MPKIQIKDGVIRALGAIVRSSTEMLERSKAMRTQKYILPAFRGRDHKVTIASNRDAGHCVLVQAQTPGSKTAIRRQQGIKLLHELRGKLQTMLTPPVDHCAGPAGVILPGLPLA